MTEVSPSAAATAVVAFAATNIDDFCVLIIFFARVKIGEMRAVHVILGQTLGFTLICAFSLIGIAVGVFVPPGYVGLVGFLPLLLGFWRLLKLIQGKAIPWVKEKRGKRNTVESNVPPNEPTLQNEAPNDTLAAHPDSDKSHAQGAEEHQTEEDKAPHFPGLIDPEASETPVPSTESNNRNTDGTKRNTFLDRLRICVHPALLEVALLTVANGGDNVGVYLFATASAAVIITTLVIFYCLLVVWLLVSYALVQCPIVAKTLSAYGEYIVPFVLMGLGLYILWGTVLFDSVRE